MKQKIVEATKEAMETGGLTLRRCSEVIEVNEKTLRSWFKCTEDKRESAVRNPKNKISKETEEEILKICKSKEYVDLSPRIIFHKLLDLGVYHACPSKIYEILHKYGLFSHRGKSKKNLFCPKSHVKLNRSNQLWSWDITYLKTAISGKYFYLYLMLDVYDAYIVGAKVFERESSENAREFFKSVYVKNESPRELQVHQDNGAPMKSADFFTLLHMLDLKCTYSRPSVSNDNAFSEALFKTLKYVPTFPRKGFKSIEEAQKWVDDFVVWYHTIHLHSGIGYVTPQDRRKKTDIEIFKKRNEVLAQARKNFPERFNSSKILKYKRKEEFIFNAHQLDRKDAVELLGA